MTNVIFIERIRSNFVSGKIEQIMNTQNCFHCGLHIGGRQLGHVVEMEVLSSVSQSYLTQLWSNEVFKKKIHAPIKHLPIL